MDKNLVALLLSRIDVKEPQYCWPWRGARNEEGYGYLHVERFPRLAHRLALKWFSGEEGEVARHTCDNPICCNPNHLEWGSHGDNANDRVIRGRGAHGATNGRAKLTEGDVRYIHRDPRSTADLARHFEVNYATIRDIRSGKNWAHVAREFGIEPPAAPVRVKRRKILN
jgi:hypothetical protein